MVWLYSALGVAALVLIVATLISVVRNSGMGVGEKILWAILTICFPFFGSLVYFTVRRGW